MPAVSPRDVKVEYEKRANILLASGHLGHGVHEDLLLDAAAWFHKQLIPNGGALADFFAAALEHHVAIYFAVTLDGRDDAADLHAFLQVVLEWLRALPRSFVEKTPEPLGLVVGHTGTGYNLGAQIMRKAGPSLIYWRAFRNLRANEARGYRSLSHQIRRTLVHELIGHQLAFCSPAGPLIPRADLAAIFDAAGIEYLKLVDAPAIHVDRFLEHDDLLAATQRIQYFSCRRNLRKYYSNLTELIAFSVEGSSPAAGLPYARTLEILKRNFLRVLNPIGRIESPNHGNARSLCQGFDFGQEGFPNYYIQECADGGWTETKALLDRGWWLTEYELQMASAAQRSDLDNAPAHALEPGRKFFLRWQSGGYLLQVQHVALLVSNFGLQRIHEQTYPTTIEGQGFKVQSVVQSNGNCSGMEIENVGATPLTFNLLELDPALFADVQDMTSSGKRAKG